MMSSILDDTFFVLKQTCMRALSTGSMHCFVSTVSLAVGQLMGSFRDSLSRKLTGCSNGILQLLTSIDPPTAAAVEAMAAPLNNLVLSAVYTSKMHSLLESEAVQRCDDVSDAIQCPSFCHYCPGFKMLASTIEHEQGTAHNTLICWTLALSHGILMTAWIWHMSEREL
jgi:hypothetical protein